MDVRRATARLATALLLSGAALVAGPSALAQEADPCAPAADGSVPEMCQGGQAPEPDPSDPCPAQPVEPGDGVVTDEGDQGIAVGEPHPDAPPSDAEEPVQEGEVKPEPAPDEPTSSDPTMDAPVVADPTVICAFGVPVSAPVDSGAPEAAAGGGAAAPEVAAPDAAANGAVAAGQLPRTGPMERLLALAALGAGLLLAGAGANRAGRRPATA